jgi:hypothetical protein
MQMTGPGPSPWSSSNSICFSADKSPARVKGAREGGRCDIHKLQWNDSFPSEISYSSRAAKFVEESEALTGGRELIGRDHFCLDSDS